MIAADDMMRAIDEKMRAAEDDYMKNSNFGMGVLHVKRQIVTYFSGRICDLDLWPMKVNYFVWIDYQHISVLY